MKGKFHIRLPIAYTLMLYILLLISLAVGISTYFTVKQESKVLTKNLIHLSEYIASNIAASAESAFWSLNWIFVEKLPDPDNNRFQSRHRGYHAPERCKGKGDYQICKSGHK